MKSVPKVIYQFADKLNLKVDQNRLEIPKQYGSGYCEGFIFNEHMDMLVLNYELNENVTFKNPHIGQVSKKILFKLQNIIPKSEQRENNMLDIPSVLIGTSRIDTDDIISVDSNTSSINIEISSGYLNSLFDVSKTSSSLQSLLEGAQPLLFEQIISSKLQNMIDEIVFRTIDKTFELFYLRVKAEELICGLLMELEKRNEKRIFALNKSDIMAIYAIRNKMLLNIEIKPSINDLAQEVNMSPSKLKRLFKQIFGDSIFNYYQKFRMKEAARLLEEGLSVSEVGYQVGFTNLSHFARVFKKHYNQNPKQFSLS